MRRLLRSLLVVLPLLFIAQSSITAAHACCCPDHAACGDCCDCCDCCGD